MQSAKTIAILVNGFKIRNWIRNAKKSALYEVDRGSVNHEDIASARILKSILKNSNTETIAQIWSGSVSANMVVAGKTSQIWSGLLTNIIKKMPLWEAFGPSGQSNI